MKKNKATCPDISIIMAVYNAEEYLEEAIRSMLNQSFKNFEFIIIDDGSYDNSLDLIKKFALFDNRVSFISRANKGLIYSLNEALKKSKGHYIARMDADDISCPERLKKQYMFMKESGLDVCGGDYISINHDGSINNTHEVPKTTIEILLSMASRVPFAHPSVMIRRSFLSKHSLKYGMYGDKVAEDLDLWMNMYNAGAKFGNLESCILKYRLLPNSLSVVNHRVMKKEVNKQFDIFVKNNRESFKNALELFCSNHYNNKQQQRLAIKALMRYLYVDLNFKLLYRCISKVRLKNLTFGILSHIKSKFVIW